MRNTLRRVYALLAIVGAAAALTVPVPRAGAQSALSSKRFGPDIDAYAYEPAQSCDNSPRPGVDAFRALALEANPLATDAGTYACRSVRGRGNTSDHAEARAWDMGLDAHDPVQREAGDAFVSALLAPDEFGAPHALARRFGIQTIIWNRQFWSTRDGQQDMNLQPYEGSNGHEDHIHFSFTWAGANAQTSYWSAAPEPETDTDAAQTETSFRIGDVRRHPSMS